jgi:thiamine-phosphate pyrophosphorylase
VTRRGGPPLPWICLVTDQAAGSGGYNGLERAVAGALEGGVNVVQLRDRGLPAGELYELGRRLLRLVREAGAALLVNDRLDVALALEADGVHLGEAGLPIPVARDLAGERLVGRSVHDLARAVEAEQAGADYLVVGTIFPSESHPGQLAAGPHLIKKIHQRTKAPLVAIGGITPENAPQVIADGASGVAVIRSILADPFPRRAARRLADSVHEAWPSAVLHRGA